MKMKFEFTTVNTKEFFFSENREEAEQSVNDLYGIEPTTDNLIEVKYEIFG